MNCKNKRIFSKKKAFTLIELLIVIAIIGILFVVLVSKVDFATDKAKATGVQTDFRSFQVAIETVIKENSGLNTFGWDTGDANADRVRNSYDKGDTNKNGKQDDGEVFVGSKAYGETWTGIYTLVKPGTTDLDADAVFALESAINKNLDPKLHITIGTDGKITMANQARDPWNTEYHGYYISNAVNDNKDRGAIVIYSNGANQEWGSEHSIANGIVTVNVPGNNLYGKDDYSLAVVYSYVNGYGEVKTTTSGFSNNQGDTNNPGMPGGTGGSNSNLGGGSGENVNDPSAPIPTTLEAGIYDAAGTMLASWDELVTVYNMDIYTDYAYNNASTTPTSPTYIINNYFPNTYTVVIQGSGKLGNCTFMNANIVECYISEGFTEIGQSAFNTCSKLATVSLPSTVQILGSSSFYYTISLTNINWPASLTDIYDYSFYMSAIKEVILPMGVTKIYPSSFNDCSNIERVEIPGVVMVDDSGFQSCTSLKTVKFGSNLKTLGYESFCNCISLTSVELPEGLEKMDSYTFQYCTSLSNVILPSTVKHLGYQVFYKNPIEYLYIPDGVTYIDDIISDYNSIGTLKAISLPGTITTYNGVLNLGTSCKTVVLRKTDGVYDLNYLSWGQLSSQELYVPADLINDYLNHFVIKDYQCTDASKVHPITEAPEIPWFEPNTNASASKLDQYSWSELKAMAQLKLTAEQYKSQYGIELGQIKDNKYMLVDFNNYDGFVFMYCTGVYGAYSEGRSTSGGYAASLWVDNMKKAYDGMSSDLKSNIKEVNIVCGTTYGLTDTTNLTCHIFLPSLKEVGGTEFNGAGDLEGEAFEYFTNDAARLTAFSFFSANGWRSGGALRSIYGIEDYARVDIYSGSVSGRTQSPNSSSWAYGAFVIG